LTCWSHFHTFTLSLHLSFPCSYPCNPQACEGDARLDFSLSAMQNVDGNICTNGLVQGITWEIQDVQVQPFIN
jgi:hypothetical protein